MTQPKSVREAPRYLCDLILKGGITSGVVYPPAIVELSRDHKFCSIGGDWMVHSSPAAPHGFGPAIFPYLSDQTR